MSRSLLLPLLLLPSTAFADLTVFGFDCAPSLAVDLDQATLVTSIGDADLYQIPPVAWQGTQISGVVVQVNASLGVINIGDAGGTHTVVLTAEPGVVDRADPFATLQLGDFAQAEYQVDLAPACDVTSIASAEPLDFAIEQMRQTANTYNPGGPVVYDDQGPERLRTSRFHSELEQVATLLTGAGCTVDPLDNIAGSFRTGPGMVTGQGSDGSPLAATLRLRSHRIDGTLDGVELGGRSSVFDATHRFVADYEGGFVVGYAARVAGRSGVFMGLQAFCPSSVSAEATLGGWVERPVVGLDPVAPPVDLRGIWAAAIDCGALGFFEETWNITDTGPTTFSIAGSTNFDIATETAPLVYDLDLSSTPPGLAFEASVSLDDDDHLSGVLDVTSPIFTSCPISGTRL